MTIQARLGFLFISFDSEDFEFKGGKEPGAALQFIEDMKATFPAKSLARPQGRDFNPDAKEWSIEDTKENRRIIEGLKKLYLEDPQQLAIFNEEEQRD